MRRFVTILALALLLVVNPPAIAGKDREKEKALKKAWKEAQEAFAIAYKSDDPKIRRKAVLKLRAFADMGAAGLMVDTVLEKEKNAGVQEAAIQVVAASSNAKVVDWLVSKARGRGNWRIRAAVTEALASVESPKADVCLRALAEREKDPRVLSMALFGIGEKGMKDAHPIVVPHLEHEDWQVRVAAIEVLGRFKEDRAILPLIDRLMNERGRLREDLADALKAITGKKFGPDANAWRKWLNERDANGGADEAKPKPEKKGVASGVRDEPTYFGMKVKSDRVLFVIDVSMSMRTPIDIDKMKLAREAALTGDAEAEKDDKSRERFEDTVKWWKIKDRLDLAKAQLKFVIKNLKKTQQFEIVSFSETIESWNGGRLQKATPRAKAKAIQFIDPLDVEGATAAGAALDFSFELAGPGSHDKNYKTGVDTIFFLSDGKPSDRNEDEILEEIRLRNRLRKIKIHVVAIVNHSVRFLRLLAEQNGGVYRFFKVEDKK